jgi:hypothetical protein
MTEASLWQHRSPLDQAADDCIMVERRVVVKDFFKVIFLAILVSTAAQAQQFRFTFSGHDAGGVSDTLEFGVDPQATLCEDTAIGEKNNTGPPPFPFMFTWTNPRVDGACDPNGCFDCGRISKKFGIPPLDLRGYTSPTQVDTYKVSFYSYDAGIPFFLSWTGDFSTYCDSMKLMYHGTVAGFVVVDMFNTSSHSITDASVSSVDIIRWGARQSLLGSPILLSPPLNGTDIPSPVVFRWRKVTDALSYRVQISLDSMFLSSLRTDSTLIDTSMSVEDLSPGVVYFWRARASNISGPGPWSSRWRFTTQYAPRPVEISLAAGWNIVSVPVMLPDYRKMAVFPTSVSAAYAYYLSSYDLRDTLHQGDGYWLKFSNDTSLTINGPPLAKDTIDVVKGWNMIGSLSNLIATNSISSIPGGLLTSRFFGYSNAYYPSDTLMPGYGYWVRVNQTGKLILSAAPSLQKPGVAGLIKEVYDNELPPPPPEYLGQVVRSLPASYSLDQNFPNPGNPQSVIGYALPQEGHVVLVVYNTLGQMVAVLVDDIKAAGYHQAVLDGSGLPSGVYYYKINAGDFTQTKRLLLLK